MSSGKVTPAGRSLVMTRICGGCTTAGNRDRYTVSQCPWVKSRNMGRVAARSHDTAGLRIGRQPMFLQILAAPNNRHAILSVQAVLGAAIRTDRSRRLRARTHVLRLGSSHNSTPYLRSAHQ